MRLYLRLAEGSRRFDFSDGQYLVGRGPAADIRIDQREVSSRHAMLRVAGERLFVTDLGSRNGTYVGGEPVDAGGREVEVPAEGAVLVADVALTRTAQRAPREGRSTHTLITARTYFDDQHGLVGVSTGNIGQMLSSLFALIATDGLADGFEDQACRFVGRWLRCDRAVLMLDFGPGSELAVWGAWSRSGADMDDVGLSEAITDEVCERRASLLLNNPSPLPVAGISAAGAAMAVPLFDNERVRGILYAEALSPENPYTEADLEALTATANAIAIKLSNRDHEQALSVARRIQRRMCPTRRPTIPGYEVAARLESCYAVGGDFFHVGEVIDGRVLVALGDVAGKGLPAALTMAACSVLIPALARYCDRPCAIVQELFRSLKDKVAPEQYVSLFLGELDLVDGELSYVNAGHVAPLLVHADGAIERLGSTSGPVGLSSGFECRGARVWLAPGDLLTLFSDGVTEATLHADQFFERDTAEGIVLAHRNQSLREITDLMFTEIAKFLKGGHNSDDTTLLMLRRER